MIKKLQVKFVIIIMSMMSVVLLCIFGAINLTMLRSTNMQTLDMMRKIAESDGRLKGKDKPGTLTERPPEKRNDLMPQTNFSVLLDVQGNTTELIPDKNQSYTEEEMTTYLKSALDSGKTQGSTGDLKFLIQQKPYGKIVVFLDNSMQLNSTIRLFWITLFVGVAGLIVIFFLSLYLSMRAIQPVKKAYEAQKRFVADASHELKTPLTVISANIDVLSPDMEDNKWLQFIKAETQRMSGLVNNLLYLAKSDAAENAYEMKEFDLSESMIGVALPFESICYEEDKQLKLEVKSDIVYKGDEQRLLQVVVILLDNAVKNTNKSGEIIVRLSQQNGKRLISVYNTGDGLTAEDKAKIFDRFYRGDSSRARQTGGYGLGLSIAKAIVDAHKGKLTVESEQGKWAKFTVVL